MNKAEYEMISDSFKREVDWTLSDELSELRDRSGARIRLWALRLLAVDMGAALKSNARKSGNERFDYDAWLDATGTRTVHDEIEDLV